MALEVMDFISRRLKEYQAQDNELYNLEATPGEGASYRFAKHDKEKYPDIVVGNKKGVFVFEHQVTGAKP